MEWSDKVKMSELSREKDCNEDFKQHVLTHINDFDSQAWSIFCECVSLVPQEMERNVEFWKKIHKAIGESRDKISKADMRTMLRISLIESICEDDLNMKSNE